MMISKSIPTKCNGYFTANTALKLINAIYNAVGVRILSLPATQENIVEALKQKKNNI